MQNVNLDTFESDQQNKTYVPKPQRKEKTYKQKIMLVIVLPESQNKRNDRKPHGKEKNTSRR